MNLNMWDAVPRSRDFIPGVHTSANASASRGRIAGRTGWTAASVQPKFSL